LTESKAKTNAVSATIVAITMIVLVCGAARAAEPEEDGIPFVSPYAAAVETPSAPNAWGGPRTGSEPTLSDRVVKYEIDATLDPKAHVIDGVEKLTWRNRSDRTVRAVYLHLYLNAFEGPGSTFFTESRQNALSFRSNVHLEDGQWGHIELKKVEQNGEPVPFRFVHPDNGPETDHTVVRFDLPTPVPAGGTMTLDIVFRDQLPRVIARTGYFGSFHMVAQWFPKIGVLELAGERGATVPRWNVHEFHMHSEFYADFGEYDVRLTVPKGFQVASAGEEQGTPVVKGEWITHRFTQNDIHDFAWMAVDNFEPPLEAVYDGPGSPHVAVKVFYPEEYVASARRALQATLDSLKWFSETLGPYPYRTSTCIVPPYNAREAGGMEYQTIFTSEGFRTAEPDTLQGVAVDFVTIHEFGHGYFYGILASNEFEEPFLDEGLNEFWDIRMMETRGQQVHIATPFLKRIGFDPADSGFDVQRIGGALDPHPADPLGQNSWNRVSTRSYGQVYSRTAILMRDLEARIGKSAMERGFRAYYDKWRFRHPSAADLREALAEATGQRAAVEQVFRQNVYGAEAIDDRIESLVSEEELPEPGRMFVDDRWIERSRDDVKKEIEAKRKAWRLAHPDAKKGEGPFPFRTTVTVRRDGAPVPQTLSVKFEDGTSESVQWDDDARWHRFTFVKSIRAKSAEIDERRNHYLDYDKLNDGRALEADRSASRRWGLDLSSVIEVIYALLGAL
jgi:hypothetical protein